MVGVHEHRGRSDIEVDHVATTVHISHSVHDIYILIQLPNLLDLEQRLPDFPNCDNYGSLSANNPDPMLDNTPTNDSELHWVIFNNFKINYF